MFFKIEATKVGEYTYSYRLRLMFFTGKITTWYTNASSALTADEGFVSFPCPACRPCACVWM